MRLALRGVTAMPNGATLRVVAGNAVTGLAAMKRKQTARQNNVLCVLPLRRCCLALWREGRGGGQKWRGGACYLETHF